MGMGVFQQKERKMPGAHKIGAAISGPRIAGRKVTDIGLFLMYSAAPDARTLWCRALPQSCYLVPTRPPNRALEDQIVTFQPQDKGHGRLGDIYVCVMLHSKSGKTF